MKFHIMKNAKQKIITGFLVFLMLLGGCVTPSLHPIYHKSDLIFNEELVGEWLGTYSIWTVERENKTSYRLTYKECADPINNPQDYSSCTLAEFKMNVIKLDDKYYADFYPINYTNTDNQLLLFHLKAFHTFAQIYFDEEVLQISFLDNQWLEELLLKKPKQIDHIVIDKGILLTASTNELQDFIIKHASNTEAFTNTISLDRNTLYK